MEIYTQETMSLLKEKPVLTDGQIYIYVLLNTNNAIKIGKTTNIQQRIQELSGSNGGGEKISKVYCSPPTWISVMETFCHEHFYSYRIPGTEWFKGYDLEYEDVVAWVDSQFQTDSYKRSNAY